MSKTIFFTYKVVNRFLVFYYVFNDSIYFLMCRISKEYRFYVSVSNANVNHTVFFFILTSKLVFFDYSVHIVFGMSTSYYTILSATIHGLCIDVQFFFFVLYKPTIIFKHIVVFYYFVVNFLAVFVGSFRKIDFGFCYVQQRMWVSTGFNASFGRV